AMALLEASCCWDPRFLALKHSNHIHGRVACAGTCCGPDDRRGRSSGASSSHFRDYQGRTQFFHCVCKVRLTSALTLQFFLCVQSMQLSDGIKNVPITIEEDATL